MIMSTVLPEDLQPSDVPCDWWTRSSTAVSAWLGQGKLSITGPVIERLLFTHPDLVVPVLQQHPSKRVRDWSRTLDDRGQPLPSGWKGKTLGWHGQTTSLLHMLLRHGTAAMLDTALTQGASLSLAEAAKTAGAPLALLMVMARRTLTTFTGEPLNPRTPEERHAQEHSLLEVLAQHEHEALGGAHTGNTLMHAVRLKAPARVLDALTEHGLDSAALRQGGYRRAARVAQVELIREQGNPAVLDRFLTWGVPLGHGPGDDGMALDVILFHRPHAATAHDPGESRSACTKRQIALLEVLERHGWTPGPVFRDRALGAAVSSGAPLSLWSALLRRGARPHGKDAKGNTLWHRLSLTHAHPDQVKALLKLKVDPWITNHAGLTGLDCLRQRMSEEGVTVSAHVNAAVQLLEQAMLNRTMEASMAQPEARARPRL